MYERMLDKSAAPSFAEFCEYCGKASSAFLMLDSFLQNELNYEKLLRFPYGNSYGWGYKYFIKSCHICDIFAENGAFTVMLRLPNKAFESVYTLLSEYSKEFVDKKYPCGEGGYIHYRVLGEENLSDIETLIKLKKSGNKNTPAKK